MTATALTVEAFLCDTVKQEGSKLQALGIGWTTLTAAGFPTSHQRIGVGMLFRVPYTATDELHEWTLQIDDEDGRPMAFGDGAGDDADPRYVEDGRVVRFGSTFSRSRPPELPVGAEQIVVWPIELHDIHFARPGRHAIVVTVDGTEAIRLPFRVEQAPARLVATRTR